MQKSKYLSVATALGFAISLVIALPVLAATTMQGQGWGGPGGMHRGNGGGVFGTVSAVSGTTLTVTSEMRPNTTSVATASTTYTVDASNAKVYEGGATTTVSVSNIAVGDTVMVQGTVTGSSIVATVIRDGVGTMTGRSGMPGGKGFGAHGASSTPRVAPAIQGNGEPVIGGAVTVIDGTTLTVTNASYVTYSVNAASSTVIKDGASTTIASVAVGDNLIVQGTVSGTSVTASSIIDQGAKGGNASSSGAPASGSHGGGFGFGGIFSAVGGFFKHLFGF